MATRRKPPRLPTFEDAARARLAKLKATKVATGEPRPAGRSWRASFRGVPGTRTPQVSFLRRYFTD